MTPRKVSSTLERIAREFGRLRKGKNEVEEVFKTPRKTEKDSKPKVLRKMKSLGALSELKHSNASTATVGAKTPKKAKQHDKAAVRREKLGI